MKLHEVQPSAILPSLLQQVELSLNFTSASAITINTIASFVKVKLSDFKLASLRVVASLLFYLRRDMIKVESRSRLTFCA